MDGLINSAMSYIDSILGVSLSAKKNPMEKNLTILIRGSYRCYDAELLENRFLMVIPHNDTLPSPARLKKHFSQIQKTTGFFPVFLCSNLTEYSRRELIKNQINFIVPDNQLYIPFLGMSLREHYKMNQIQDTKQLSTVAQLVLLYHFHNTSIEISPTLLAEKLGYTVMSVLRAFKELEACGLGTLTKRGRTNILKFNAKGEELWTQSLPLLVSPVKRTVSLPEDYKNHEEFSLCGLSLLSEWIMLNPPEHVVYRIALSRFNELNKQNPWNILPAEASEKIELQLWRYPPTLISGIDQIDRLSLYLSLRETADERIKFALEELLEEFEW